MTNSNSVSARARAMQGRGRRITIFAACLSVVAALAWSAPAAAQETAAGQCPDGTVGAPWIGVHAFHCPGGTCSSSLLYFIDRSNEVTTVDVTTGRRVDFTTGAKYEFSAEPWLRGIDSGGPAAGILEEGDVLVAVNGFLITSSRGGLELGSLSLDEDVVLTLRRDDRLIEVDLRPIRRCALPIGISGNTLLRLPYDRLEYDAAGTGTLGASFRCDDCSFTLSGDGELTWDNPQYLTLEAVELGGPADLAGLRAGDLVLSANGFDLTSDEGGNLLLNADGGVLLELGVEREGVRIVTELVTGQGSRQRDPREDFVVYRDKSWGTALSDILTGWFGGESPENAIEANSIRLALEPEFALTVSGASWAPSVYGAVLEWCDECRWIAGKELGWEMPEYPVVESITEGGAADRAGLRIGDVLTHIDGLDMKTEEGGRRFINLRTGDEVQIRFLRDGRERRGTLIAGKVLDDGR